MFAVIGGVVAILAGTSVGRAQEPPEMPKPVKEHKWLEQLAGEWESHVEAFMEPGKPPMKSKGTESARKIGGFWILAETKGEFMGAPYNGLLTLGYDADRKVYVGTWVDSMSGYLWKYDGKVDKSGKVLTLETEGPCPHAPGTLSKFKETLEIKSKTHKVFSSAIQGEDGKWTTMMTINYYRK
jgi:hypothetical protein